MFKKTFRYTMTLSFRHTSLCRLEFFFMNFKLFFTTYYDFFHIFRQTFFGHMLFKKKYTILWLSFHIFRQTILWPLFRIFQQYSMTFFHIFWHTILGSIFRNFRHVFWHTIIWFFFQTYYDVLHFCSTYYTTLSSKY